MIRRLLILVLLAVLSAPACAFGQVSEDGYEEEFPTTLTREVAETLFTAEVLRLYGPAWEGADTQWIKCPQEEFFDPYWDEEEGTYWGAWQLCEARFSIGKTWRAITVVVTDTPAGPVVGEPSTGTWRRGWRAAGKGCAGSEDPQGRTWTNNGRGCPFMLVADLAYDLKTKRRLSPRYYSRGTNKVGFGDVYIWRCKIKRPTIRCANPLGDAYKYTPSPALRRRIGWS